MSDQVLLWCVLVVVYGWECACWLGRDSVALITWLGRGWRLRNPGRLVGNQRGGFVAVPPLPPLGTILVASSLPVSLSAQGVLGFVSATLGAGGRSAQSGAFFRMEDLAQIRVRNRKLFVGGRFLAQCDSVVAANQLAATLKLLAAAPAETRERELQRIVRSMFQLGGLQTVWNMFQASSRGLRCCTNALFCDLFLIIPAAIWFLGLGRSWVLLLVLLLGLTTTAAVLFHRLHRQLYPELEDERFTHCILVWLSPATSIRAVDTLSRPLLQAYHPLVVAAHFLNPAAFRAFATRALLELRHPALPVCPVGDEAAVATELFWRSLLLGEVERFLKKRELDPQELLAPPTLVEESCSAYCPRCRTQFTRGTDSCADCGGMPLLPFFKPAGNTPK